jgi:pantothenate kinase type III
VEFVTCLKNLNTITGVKVAKKLPEELGGDVTCNSIAFKVENKESHH